MMELPEIEIPVLNDDGTPQQIQMPPGERARVLIVDDNPSKLAALVAIVSDLELEVVTVGSGREALRQLLQRDFAVILLDVRMPVMDGYETAQLIRTRPRSLHTPIIFITAEAMSEEERDRGYALGAVDWMLSPIRPDILQAKIKVFADLFYLNLIARRQAEQLKALNDTLEEKVRERTAALSVEVKEHFEAELRYHALFELLPDAVVILDDKANIVEFNDAACRQLGYSREEFGKLEPADFEAGARIEQIARDETVAEYETRHRNKAGALLEIRVRANPLKLGDRHFVQSVFLDVTQLKQAEKLEAEAKANAERVAQLERELKSMARLSQPPQAATGEAAHRLPLNETGPDVFKMLEGRYIELIDQAVKRQTHRVEYDISGSLHAMAAEMAALQAGPRDVVLVHNQALKARLGSVKYEAKNAYIEEGRLLVLELMGYLARCYMESAAAPAKPEPNTKPEPKAKRKLKGS